ncbi:MAG: tRNA preQ1(34) S-adenosylmethionine ribosyltransferase-isomerase QueA, partial [Pseudomonadota bacterium]|nr:tRNA preQ1(34) S-adenosylmethionine ribosyltransferase-isomerase QueA [Pseudomonadota bacterium]
MKLSDFDYELPPEAIAAEPARPRHAARLLDLDGGAIHDRTVRDLPSVLRAGDLLVVNNTRVIPARLAGRRGEAGIGVTLHKHEGGADWQVFAKPARKCRPDDVIHFGTGFAARVRGRGEGGEVGITFIDPHSGGELDQAAIETGLATHGSMPLPPYIRRPDGSTSADDRDYQTMFAAQAGAVAAPTAGLHFTPELASALRDAGIGIAEVTLHVGAGTFLPVTVENIAEHRMHAEWGHIPAATAAQINTARERGGRVVCVGTTSLRILEACYAAHGEVREFAAETDNFITPGSLFGAVDMLLTNFHLPKSTLLML